MMYSIITAITLSAATVSASSYGSKLPAGHPTPPGDLFNNWAPAGPGDVRGPCPMMNTLANHHFLPHDGRNITRENAHYAIGTALNFNSSLIDVMFDQAIIANPAPNATFFTLKQLQVHNLLEHDASISRQDAYFGNGFKFNQKIYDGTKKYWTNETITKGMLANAKIARQLAGKAFNPEYNFPKRFEPFQLGELAAPVVAFGDKKAITTNRTLVNYFFEHERLPTELGWSTVKEMVQQEEVVNVFLAIGEAASLMTPDDTPAPAIPARRSVNIKEVRNLHLGY